MDHREVGIGEILVLFIVIMAFVLVLNLTFVGQFQPIFAAIISVVCEIIILKPSSRRHHKDDT